MRVLPAVGRLALAHDSHESVSRRSVPRGAESADDARARRRVSTRGPRAHRRRRWLRGGRASLLHFRAYRLAAARASRGVAALVWLVEAGYALVARNRAFFSRSCADAQRLTGSRSYAPRTHVDMLRRCAGAARVVLRARM